MRVRMIRPAYWTDADLHTRLTAEVREFYIGLWMLADDAGYVAWDVDRVGAELYPYRPLDERRAFLPKWVGELGAHLVILPCGQHIVIPSLSRYQSPPKPSYQNQRAHDRCIRQMAAGGASGDQRGPAGTSTGREGKGRGFRKGKGFIEGGSLGDDALTQEETSDFRRKVAAPL